MAASARGLVLGGGALLALAAGGAAWMVLGPGEAQSHPHPQRDRDRDRDKDITGSGNSKGVPDHRSAQWDENRRRNIMVLDAIKRSAETEHNVASHAGWIKDLWSEPGARGSGKDQR